METTVKKNKQKKKLTIRSLLVSLSIDPNKKINIRELIVEVLSLYILTILVTSIVQIFILDVGMITFKICLGKSAITNIFAAVFAMLGLNVPKVKSNLLLSAILYAVLAIPYADSFIIFYREGVSVLQVLLVYFLVYFFLGFFIQRFLNLLRKNLNRVLHNGSRSWLPFFLIKKNLRQISEGFLCRSLYD